MLTSLFHSSTLPVLEQVLNFTEARHGVLAGNIANFDTPGYLARDLSPEIFRERLKSAIETRDRPAGPYGAVEPRTYGNYAIEQSREFDAFREVADPEKTLLYHDGHDVSLEQQVNEIVKNQQEHNLAVNIMSAQLRLLRAAITERVA